MRGWFDKLATRVSQWVGSPWAFCLAFLAILAWGAVGPIFHFSDTWQLVCNTGTTIITFLMVFLIQNTQNRDQAENTGLTRESVEKNDKALGLLTEMVGEVRQMIHDLPWVNEHRARALAEDDDKEG